MVLVGPLGGGELDGVRGLTGGVALIPDRGPVEGVLDVDVLVSAVEALAKGPADLDVVYRV